MLIAYTLVVLLAVALIAYVVIRSRSRRAQQGSADASGAPAKVAPADARASLSRPAARPHEADADATRVHMRTSQASASASPQKREGTTPAVAAARLVGLSGGQKHVSFPVIEAGITIGRNTSCDVVLADHRVSARHAWIGIVNGKFVLHDLKSTNGTFINTQTQPVVGEIELRSGDTILFGSHQGDQFRFLAD